MSKEHAEKDMQIRVQPTLYNEFRQTCDDNYKKVSEVIRELMLEYISKRKKSMSNATELDPVIKELYKVENEGGSGVTTAIKEVMCVLNKYGKNHESNDLDYGAKVRILTKTMMIINEQHRLYQNRIDEVPAWLCDI